MLELRRDDLQLFLIHYSFFVSVLYCYIWAILNLKSTPNLTPNSTPCFTTCLFFLHKDIIKYLSSYPFDTSTSFCVYWTMTSTWKNYHTRTCIWHLCAFSLIFVHLKQYDLTICTQDFKTFSMVPCTSTIVLFLLNHLSILNWYIHYTLNLHNKGLNSFINIVKIFIFMWIY